MTDCACLMGTQMGALRVSAKGFPSVIGPKKQAMHSIVFACAAPFAASPLLTLSFSHAGQAYNYTFPSAVTTKHFVTPTVGGIIVMSGVFSPSRTSRCRHTKLCRCVSRLTFSSMQMVFRTCLWMCISSAGSPWAMIRRKC